MYTRHCLVWGLLAAALVFAQEGPPTVQVTGAVRQALTLTAADLAKMPRASVHTTNNGVDTVYDGVWVSEILKRTGVPQGNQLKGKALAGYVLAEAQDGYQVVFSSAELDPGFTDSEILLADAVNGKPFSGAHDRFHLIAPKDKAGARWVRMLTKLEIVQVGK